MMNMKFTADQLQLIRLLCDMCIHRLENPEREDACELLAFIELNLFVKSVIRDKSTMTNHVLPEFPKAHSEIVSGRGPAIAAYRLDDRPIKLWQKFYVADQMTEYGQSCAEAARRAEIDRIKAAFFDCEKIITKSLAAILTVPTPDKLFDIDATPRSPVLSQVGHIHDAVLQFRKALK